MDSDDDNTPMSSMNSNNKHEEDKQTADLTKLESAWRIGTGLAHVAFANDKKHRWKCRQNQCTRCNFVDRGPELANITPMLPPDMRKLAHISADKVLAANGCWLASAIVDGQWGLGCIACCARSLPGAFGSFSWRGAGEKGQLKAFRLEKHHKSNEHRSAVAAYFGIMDVLRREVRPHKKC